MSGGRHSIGKFASEGNHFLIADPGGGSHQAWAVTLPLHVQA